LISFGLIGSFQKTPLHRPFSAQAVMAEFEPHPAAALPSQDEWDEDSYLQNEFPDASGEPQKDPPHQMVRKSRKCSTRVSVNGQVTPPPQFCNSLHAAHSSIRFLGSFMRINFLKNRSFDM
jgi:hypothetical protein